ncbi:phage major tail tube protein [Algimonas porphyrae]|uniref:Phage major tail tube protein n=1 Tax=Algimonas porphyrae TaxID=1128113 RepID=A0ABQ5V024_9PROT|nr:phage major tail tube protein [Algimonas porphyrae]GLQ20514.1 hypothetical protein GCM10007854_14690 [Algimonas porphyrae]
MIELPKVVSDFTAFIDGRGLAGRINEAKIPAIGLVTEEHTAGGMGGTVDIWMGLVEKMETEVTVDGMSAAFTEGLGRSDFPLTLRGVLVNDDVTEQAIFQTRGLYKKAEFGDLKRKDKGSQKLMATLSYFKATIGSVEIVEVDVINKIFIVDGVDRFAEHRAALGL